MQSRLMVTRSGVCKRAAEAVVDRAAREQAFEQLARETGPRALSVARGLLGTQAAAEDAVQEAFERAYRALDQYRSDAQLKSVRKQADDANNRLEEVSLAIRRSERKLRRVLEDPDTTEAQLLAVVNQLTKLHGERHRLSILMPWRIRGILTPAQRKRLGELAASSGGRRWRVRGRQGMRHGRPPHRGPGMGPFGPGMGRRGHFGPGMGPFGPGMGRRPRGFMRW